ncbi:MAG: hypothetical protein IH627_10810 [Rubrivivax sp.]|nr:hypothetical protein [Rubrivivax sp.]
MSQLKVCTYNIEWMLSLFGAQRDVDWLADPKIPDTFPGAKRGDIRFKPIADVHGLCTRIAKGIESVDPDVLFVQEGPPIPQQMSLFVKMFLNDEYAVHRSNRADQSVYALVRRSLQDDITPWVPDNSTPQVLWRGIPYYPWGTIAESARKSHNLARHPLFVRCKLASGQDLILGGVHTKSKFSKLKTKKQWDDREAKPAPVLDALSSRQKLSAEVHCLRDVLTRIVAVGPSQASVVVVGDFNDGPFFDLMEREFLIRNILDELVGTFLDPNTYFKHAMEPEILASAATTRFSDPLEGGALVEELIDHILVSPAIWSGIGAYGLKAKSCQVEEAAWQLGVVGNPEGSRENRPSDHKPVSMVLEW